MVNQYKAGWFKLRQTYGISWGSSVKAGLVV